MWCKVLYSVRKPCDLSSCYQTCKVFKRILSETQIEWTLPLILPSICGQLSTRQILNCRLVSKHWNRCVDNFLQSDEFSSSLIRLLKTDVNRKNAMFPRILTTRHQNDGLGVLWNFFGNYQSNVNEFISEFSQNCNKNPFPSRTMYVVIKLTEFDSIHPLFKKFGTHIWSLRVVLWWEVSRMTPTICQVIDVMWELLKLVPNLKHLLIVGRTLVNLKRLRDDTAQNLDTFLQQIDAPQLNNLKLIEMETGNFKFEETLQNVFRRSSVSVIRSRRLCNFLHRDHKYMRFHVPTSGWLEHLEALEHVNFPLETIYGEYFVCTDLTKLLDLLVKFGKTIRQITLVFDGLNSHEINRMKCVTDSTFVAFIYQMKCLKEFNMVFNGCPSTEIKQLVDGYLNAKWVPNYTGGGSGGIVNGYSCFGFGSISAGLKLGRAKAADESKLLKSN